MTEVLTSADLLPGAENLDSETIEWMNRNIARRDAASEAHRQLVQTLYPPDPHGGRYGISSQVAGPTYPDAGGVILADPTPEVIRGIIWRRAV